MMKYPGVVATEKGVVGNIIAGNYFEINRDVPFKNLRGNSQLILLQFRDAGQGRVSSNYYFGNDVKLSHPQAVEFAVKPGSEPLMVGQMPWVPIPEYKALGRTHPV